MTCVISNLSLNSVSHKKLPSEILTVANGRFLHLHFVLVTTQNLLSWYPSVKRISQEAPLVPERLQTGIEER